MSNLVNPLACFDPRALYKPQFAYATPEGYRDEPFAMPIHFFVRADGVIHTQLPISCDDDVPFFLHAAVFPQIGTAIQVNPALCRIRDTFGNPLSKGLVLALGALAQSGFGNVNAFGFVFEPAVACTPGGALLFDIQVSSNAPVAVAVLAFSVSVLTAVANVFGLGGNSFTIQLLDPGAPNVALSVALVGGVHVQVTLATDGAGVITSTVADVAAAMNSAASPAAAVEWAFTTGDTSELATASDVFALAGGDISTNIDLYGTLLGVKRFKECGE